MNTLVHEHIVNFPMRKEGRKTVRIKRQWKNVEQKKAHEIKTQSRKSEKNKRKEEDRQIDRKIEMPSIKHCKEKKRGDSLPW